MEFCNKGMVQADPTPPPPPVMVKDHKFTTKNWTLPLAIIFFFFKYT